MQRNARLVLVLQICLLAAVLAAAGSASLNAAPIPVRVTVENLAPTNGSFLTPVWVGFHDGSFDLYDIGAPSTPGLERLAEDGTTGPLAAEFFASGAGTTEGTLNAIGPIGPGQSVSADFLLDSSDEMNRYFSYASMIIPSNDAFIANGNPLAHMIFDAAGNFVGATFLVLGSAARDAGTEVNDEIPANTAFFGQSMPDTGVPENGTVQVHPGFIPGGNILSTAQFANADFTQPGYQIARITVTAVPEPSSIGLSLMGLGLLAWQWRRKRRAGQPATR